MRFVLTWFNYIVSYLSTSLVKYLHFWTNDVIPTYNKTASTEIHFGTAVFMQVFFDQLVVLLLW